MIPWRKVRVILEVPVYGEFREKDLATLLRSLLAERELLAGPLAQGSRFGPPKVLKYSRHIHNQYTRKSPHARSHP